MRKVSNKFKYCTKKINSWKQERENWESTNRSSVQKIYKIMSLQESWDRNLVAVMIIKRAKPIINYKLNSKNCSSKANASNRSMRQRPKRLMICKIKQGSLSTKFNRKTILSISMPTSTTPSQNIRIDLECLGKRSIASI